MNLTAIFEDAEEGGFTCWLEEMPEVISEGDTFEEAKVNLMDALQLMLEYRREEAEKDLIARKIHYRKTTLSSSLLAVA